MVWVRHSETQRILQIASQRIRARGTRDERSQMNRTQTIEGPRMIADEIPGYDYGSANVAKSPITIKELEQLKQSTGFTQGDEGWLNVAGDVLADQTKQLVEKWRAVISAYPHLAR